MQLRSFTTWLATSLAVLLLAACASSPPGGEARRPPTAPPASPPVVPQPPAQPPAIPAPAATPPAGSASVPGKGGFYKDDGPGDQPPPDMASIPDAQPRREPLHPRANRPYVALGQNFTPLQDASAYRARGIASWYGRRFHGKPTSSGERYNMYAMTAAHPTLPIPSYVRVTRVANGKSVVVRINDRGPFLHGRLIDLSYTAAWKLGYVTQGSAEVEVEAIVPDSDSVVAATVEPLATIAAPPATPAAPAPIPSAAAPATPPAGSYLQLGAFTSLRNAESFRDYAQQELKGLRQGLHILEDGERFRLQLGPFADAASARSMAERIAGILKLKPFLVQR